MSSRGRLMVEKVREKEEENRKFKALGSKHLLDKESNSRTPGLDESSKPNNIDCFQVLSKDEVTVILPLPSSAATQSYYGIDFKNGPVEMDISVQNIDVITDGGITNDTTFEEFISGAENLSDFPNEIDAGGVVLENQFALRHNEHFDTCNQSYSNCNIFGLPENNLNPTDDNLVEIVEDFVGDGENTENVETILINNLGEDEIETTVVNDDPDYVPSEESDEQGYIGQDDIMMEGNDELENTAANNAHGDGKPKKGRKRKYGDMTRAERSKRKYQYEEFINFSKKTVESKQFVDFDCNCSNRCKEKAPIDIRQKEFEKFRELGNYNAQTLYINSNVREKPKKRSYRLAEGVKSKAKEYSRVYSLNKTIVCREMFIKTLGISSKRVNTALKKMKSDSLLDQRGKQGGWNATSDDKVQEIKKFIDSIPKYISHYRRNDTDSKFLPPEMTLSKMYDQYVDGRSKDNVVSLSFFKKIFYNCFNLKFKALKKDTCNKCDTFAAKISSSNDPNETAIIKEHHNQHLLAAENAQKRLKIDMKSASADIKIECLTFDLQKTLPLPRVATNIVFYKRQLWVYNSGIHAGSNDKGYCYTWVENEAGRGSQEVGSCLLKHVKSQVPEGVEHLILWSDSCGGQNRNIKIVLLLKTMLEDHPTLKTVTQRYLVPGHSFLPNDDDFGKIENVLKRQQYIYCPEDYFKIMESCKKKKPLTVVRMTKNDFKSSSEVEKLITNRKKSVTKEDVSWLKSREILIKKDKPFSIFLSETLDGPYLELDISKKKPGRNFSSFTGGQLCPLWPDGKQISVEKLKDLKSMFHLIPKNHHNFYKSLGSGSHVEDDVDGFGCEPDFEVEHE